MSLILETEKYINDILESIGVKDIKASVLPSSMREYGQYQINVAMQLGNVLGKNPREIAEMIVSKFDDRFVNVNIQGPGFINITFSDDVLIDYSNKCLKDFNNYIDKIEEKKVILDYGGANIAKELHVGHLRCNIGESIRRLLELYGCNAISDVHWGDWGTPLGLVINEIHEMYPDLVYFDESYEGDYPQESPVTQEDLAVIYPRASMKKKEDIEYALKAKFYTQQLQSGVRGIRALWEHIVRVSKDDSKKVYDYLNCHFDLSQGESDADKYVSDVIKILEDNNVTEISDGALILPVKEDTDNKEMPPLILRKSDGAILYDTTELATIYERKINYNPDAIWYFTDERQSLHFEQTFRGAYKGKIVKPTCELKFFGFGTINGTDGKPYKTRDGGVMSLKNLIKLVYDNIEPKIKDSIQGKERIEVANKLTVATLKFSDLLPNRNTDYIFDVEKFTSFEGKTGIYIVYTTTRIKSLLNKVDNKEYIIKNIDNEDIKEILVKLSNLSSILSKSLREVLTSYICDFIYELSSLYNKFYTNNNIINESNEELKETYIAVSKLVYSVLSKLLNVLAIDEVEKM